jgi:hypothetical protein
MDGMDSDDQAIEQLINRQFASMSWTSGGGPNLNAFANDFLAGASLYPSARPLGVPSKSSGCG